MGIFRLIVLVGAAAFIGAAMIHAGMLIGGYAPREARAAETAIALGLLSGAAYAWGRPQSSWAAAVVVQGFARIGTCVGPVMIAIGRGPRTVADLIYHTVMVIALAGGLVVARRMGATPAGAA